MCNASRNRGQCARIFDLASAQAALDVCPRSLGQQPQQAEAPSARCRRADTTPRQPSRELADSGHSVAAGDMSIEDRSSRFSNAHTAGLATLSSDPAEWPVASAGMAPFSSSYTPRPPSRERSRPSRAQDSAQRGRRLSSSMLPSAHAATRLRAVSCPDYDANEAGTVLVDSI